MTKRECGFWLALGSGALVLLGGCQSLANITGRNQEHGERRVQRTDDNLSHLLSDEPVLTASSRRGRDSADRDADANPALVVEQPLQQQMRIYKEREERLRNQISQTNQQIRELQASLQADQNSLAKNQENIRITQNVMDAIRRGQIDTLAASNEASSTMGRGQTTGRRPQEAALPPMLANPAEEFSAAAPPSGWTLDEDDLGLPRNAARVPAAIESLGADVPVYDTDIRGHAPSRAPVQPRQAAVGEAWDTSLPFGAGSGEPDALILTTEGEGGDAMAMISIGQRDGVQKGMLYETTDEAGGRAILYVTEVFPTYSRVQPHVRFPPQGGLERGGGLTRLFSLPK